MLIPFSIWKYAYRLNISTLFLRGILDQYCQESRSCKNLSDFYKFASSFAVSPEYYVLMLMFIAKSSKDDGTVDCTKDNLPSYTKRARIFLLGLSSGTEHPETPCLTVMNNHREDDF